MKNKMMRTLLGMGGAVVMLLSGINVYAAPKTMSTLEKQREDNRLHRRHRQPAM